MWSPLTHLPPVSYMQDIYLPDEYHSMSHTCPADLKIIGQVKGMDFLFFNKQFFPFTKYFHGNVNISCVHIKVVTISVSSDSVEPFILMLVSKIKDLCSI